MGELSSSFIDDIGCVSGHHSQHTRRTQTWKLEGVYIYSCYNFLKLPLIKALRFDDPGTTCHNIFPYFFRPGCGALCVKQSRIGTKV